MENKNKGVMGRDVTISNINEHYDHNAATMQKPKTETFNFEKDFSFCNYIHVLYEKARSPVYDISPPVPNECGAPRAWPTCPRVRPGLKGSRTPASLRGFPGAQSGGSAARCGQAVSTYLVRKGAPQLRIIG